MRTKRLILAATAWSALLAAPAAADDISYGIIFGLNESVDGSQSEQVTVNSGPVQTIFDLSNIALGATGYMLGVTAEKEMDGNWVVGGELAYRYNNFDTSGQLDATQGGVTESLQATGDSHVSALSGMATARWYNAPSTSRTRFFVGGGVGLAQTSSISTSRAAGELHGYDINNTTKWEFDQLSFAWQAGAGMEFAVGESSRARLAYRYFSAGDSNGLSSDSHGIVLGLSF